MASNINQHNQLLALFAIYTKRLDKLYDDFVKKLIKALPLSEDEVWQKLADDPLFRFDDLPYLSARLNHIFDDYVNNQVLCYKQGITDGVALAFSQDKINLGKYTILQDEAIKAARNAAVASFVANRMSRKEGLSLSDKVWNYSQLGKSEVEMGISNVIKDGLKAGTSAEELGRKVRQYLNNPTMMYRRYWVTVADSKGGKKKVARWYRRHIDEKTGKVTFKDEPLEKVGTGVYRSARMNGYRLMRTEINISYHNANNERWKNEPFVYGIRVWLSPQHPKPDICDDLAGEYPKDFQFTSWHPACMCASAPLTLWGDEKRDFYRRLMKGEDMSDFHSKYEITEANMNPKWEQYIEQQHDSILRAGERGKLAYHLRDNQQYWIGQFSKEEQRKMGLLKDDKARIKAIADARHAARTPEQAKDIADRWHEHKRVDALVRQAVAKVAEIREYPMAGLKTDLAEKAIEGRNAAYLETWLSNKMLGKKLAYEKLISGEELKWSQFVAQFEKAKDAEFVQERMAELVAETRKAKDASTAIDWLRDKVDNSIKSMFFDDETKPLAAIDKLLKREERRMKDWYDYQRYSRNLNDIKSLVDKNADVIGGAFKRLTVSASDFYLQDLEAMRKLVNDTLYQPYFNLRGWQESAAFVANSKSPIVHQLFDGILNAYRTQGFTADVEDMVDQLEANIDRLKKLAAKRAASKLSAFDDVINSAVGKKIDYRDVKDLGKKTEDEIIKRICGADQTSGSCSSLAFTYAGNKGGLDVLDFRGGASRSFFGSDPTIKAIAEKAGGMVIDTVESDFKAAKTLLAQVKDGHEYYFACGKHAAIIKKQKDGIYYLELQSGYSNGFKRLDDDLRARLKSRFGAQAKHVQGGSHYCVVNCIIDIEDLNKDKGFRKLLGYINTDPLKQKKGAGGGIK